MGYFGIGESAQSRELSLPQPFRAILATIAYFMDYAVYCDQYWVETEYGPYEPNNMVTEFIFYDWSQIR